MNDMIKNVEIDRGQNKAIVNISGFLSLEIDGNGEYIIKTLDGIKIKITDTTILKETFLYDIHFITLDMSNYIVLDIGAFVGDTALYYASKGATVVSVEPVPENYNMLLKNVELNPQLKDKIIPINAAVAYKDEGFVKICYNSPLGTGGATIFKEDTICTNVKALSLKDLINLIKEKGINIDEYKYRVLKLDCKGCEWDIINKDYDTLSKFEIVKIEYSGYLHNFKLSDIKNKLEELGYDCRVYAHNELPLKMGFDIHGTITAYKKGIKIEC
ncbi:FkbM family methyltransferase [Acidilobus sp.]|uniref:FkbM family methyltransferase n=1 Tax=Acidilobus sp. TaxID=1872109 RepID=UPI003CFCFFB0